MAHQQLQQQRGSSSSLSSFLLPPAASLLSCEAQWHQLILEPSTVMHADERSDRLRWVGRAHEEAMAAMKRGMENEENAAFGKIVSVVVDKRGRQRRATMTQQHNFVNNKSVRFAADGEQQQGDQVAMKGRAAAAAAEEDEEATVISLIEDYLSQQIHRRLLPVVGSSSEVLLSLLATAAKGGDLIGDYGVGGQQQQRDDGNDYDGVMNASSSSCTDDDDTMSDNQEEEDNEGELIQPTALSSSSVFPFQFVIPCSSHSSTRIIVRGTTRFATAASTLETASQIVAAGDHSLGYRLGINLCIHFSRRDGQKNKKNLPSQSGQQSSSTLLLRIAGRRIADKLCGGEIVLNHIVAFYRQRLGHIRKSAASEEENPSGNSGGYYRSGGDNGGDDGLVDDYYVAEQQQNHRSLFSSYDGDDSFSDDETATEDQSTTVTCPLALAAAVGDTEAVATLVTLLMRATGMRTLSTTNVMDALSSRNGDGRRRCGDIDCGDDVGRTVMTPPCERALELSHLPPQTAALYWLSPFFGDVVAADSGQSTATYFHFSMIGQFCCVSHNILSNALKSCVWNSSNNNQNYHQNHTSEESATSSSPSSSASPSLSIILRALLEVETNLCLAATTPKEGGVESAARGSIGSELQSLADTLVRAFYTHGDNNRQSKKEKSSSSPSASSSSLSNILHSTIAPMLLFGSPPRRRCGEEEDEEEEEEEEGCVRKQVKLLILQYVAFREEKEEHEHKKNKKKRAAGSPHGGKTEEDNSHIDNLAVGAGEEEEEEEEHPLLHLFIHTKTEEDIIVCLEQLVAAVERALFAAGDDTTTTTTSPLTESYASSPSPFIHHLLSSTLLESTLDAINAKQHKEQAALSDTFRSPLRPMMRGGVVTADDKDSHCSSYPQGGGQVDGENVEDNSYSTGHRSALKKTAVSSDQQEEEKKKAKKQRSNERAVRREAKRVKNAIASTVKQYIGDDEDKAAMNVSLSFGASIRSQIAEIALSTLVSVASDELLPACVASCDHQAEERQISSTLSSWPFVHYCVAHKQHKLLAFLLTWLRSAAAATIERHSNVLDAYDTMTGTITPLGLALIRGDEVSQALLLMPELTTPPTVRAAMKTDGGSSPLPIVASLCKPFKIHQQRRQQQGEVKKENRSNTMAATPTTASGWVSPLEFMRRIQQEKEEMFWGRKGNNKKKSGGEEEDEEGHTSNDEGGDNDKTESKSSSSPSIPPPPPLPSPLHAACLDAFSPQWMDLVDDMLQTAERSEEKEKEEQRRGRNGEGKKKRTTGTSANVDCGGGGGGTTSPNVDCGGSDIRCEALLPSCRLDALCRRRPSFSSSSGSSSSSSSSSPSLFLLQRLPTPTKQQHPLIMCDHPSWRSALDIYILLKKRSGGTSKQRRGGGDQQQREREHQCDAVDFSPPCSSPSPSDPLHSSSPASFVSLTERVYHHYVQSKAAAAAAASITRIAVVDIPLTLVDVDAADVVGSSEKRRPMSTLLSEYIISSSSLAAVASPSLPTNLSSEQRIAFAFQWICRMINEMTDDVWACGAENENETIHSAKTADSTFIQHAESLQQTQQQQQQQQPAIWSALATVLLHFAASVPSAPLASPTTSSSVPLASHLSTAHRLLRDLVDGGFVTRGTLTGDLARRVATAEANRVTTTAPAESLLPRHNESANAVNVVSGKAHDHGAAVDVNDSMMLNCAADFISPIRSHSVADGDGKRSHKEEAAIGGCSSKFGVGNTSSSASIMADPQFLLSPAADEAPPSPRPNDSRLLAMPIPLYNNTNNNNSNRDLRQQMQRRGTSPRQLQQQQQQQGVVPTLTQHNNTNNSAMIHHRRSQSAASSVQTSTAIGGGGASTAAMRDENGKIAIPKNDTKKFQKSSIYLELLKREKREKDQKKKPTSVSTTPASVERRRSSTAPVGSNRGATRSSSRASAGLLLVAPSSSSSPSPIRPLRRQRGDIVKFTGDDDDGNNNADGRGGINDDRREGSPATTPSSSSSPPQQEQQLPLQPQASSSPPSTATPIPIAVESNTGQVIVFVDDIGLWVTVPPPPRTVMEVLEELLMMSDSPAATTTALSRSVAAGRKKNEGENTHDETIMNKRKNASRFDISVVEAIASVRSNNKKFEGEDSSSSSSANYSSSDAEDDEARHPRRAPQAVLAAEVLVEAFFHPHFEMVVSPTSFMSGGGGDDGNGNSTTIPHHHQPHDVRRHNPQLFRWLVSAREAYLRSLSFGVVVAIGDGQTDSKKKCRNRKDIKKGRRKKSQLSSIDLGVDSDSDEEEDPMMEPKVGFTYEFVRTPPTGEGGQSGSGGNTKRRPLLEVVKAPTSLASPHHHDHHQQLLLPSLIATIHEGDIIRFTATTTAYDASSSRQQLSVPSPQKASHTVASPSMYDQLFGEETTTASASSGGQQTPLLRFKLAANSSSHPSAATKKHCSLLIVRETIVNSGGDGGVAYSDGSSSRSKRAAAAAPIITAITAATTVISPLVRHRYSSFHGAFVQLEIVEESVRIHQQLQGNDGYYHHDDDNNRFGYGGGNGGDGDDAQWGGGLVCVRKEEVKKKRHHSCYDPSSPSRGGSLTLNALRTPQYHSPLLSSSSPRGEIARHLTYNSTSPQQQHQQQQPLLLPIAPSFSDRVVEERSAAFDAWQRVLLSS